MTHAGHTMNNETDVGIPPAAEMGGNRPTPGTTRFPAAAVVAGFCDHHQLTPRERQLVELICTGMKNTRISRELHVSEATVRLHMTNLHRKVKSSNKVELLLKLWQWSITQG